MATAYVKKSARGNKRLEKEGVVKRNSLTNYVHCQQTEYKNSILERQELLKINNIVKRFRKFGEISVCKDQKSSSLEAILH